MAWGRECYMETALIRTRPPDTPGVFRVTILKDSELRLGLRPRGLRIQRVLFRCVCTQTDVVRHKSPVVANVATYLKGPDIEDLIGTNVLGEAHVRIASGVNRCPFM